MSAPSKTVAAAMLAASGGGTVAAAAAQPAQEAASVLANLRARTLDLHARLLELRDAVAMLRDGVGPARNAPWSVFLAKYETLAKLFFQLTEELDRAVVDVGFQNFLVLPRGVAEDADLVPNMLRTRLEPDVEKDMLALQAEYVSDAAGAEGADVAAAESAESAAAAESAESAAESAAAAVLEKRIAAFNAFVGGAVDRFDDARERLLREPRPAERPLPAATPRAQELLTALTTGAALPCRRSGD
jgi:hypothetical protein